MLLTAVLFISSCGGSTAVDQTDPVKVVEALFKAAKTKNYEALPGLADPVGRIDGDVKDVCGVTKGSKMESQVIQYFANGKVIGKADIRGDEAEVNFIFGPQGTDKETMGLTRREGMWYLSNF